MFRALTMRRMSARHDGFSRTQQKESANDVFVPLVVYWLAHVLLQTLAIAVHGLT